MRMIDFGNYQLHKGPLVMYRTNSLLILKQIRHGNLVPYQFSTLVPKKLYGILIDVFNVSTTWVPETILINDLYSVNFLYNGRLKRRPSCHKKEQMTIIVIIGLNGQKFNGLDFSSNRLINGSIQWHPLYIGSQIPPFICTILHQYLSLTKHLLIHKHPL